MDPSDRQLYAEQTNIFQKKIDLMGKRHSSKLLGTMADPSYSTKVSMISDGYDGFYKHFKSTTASSKLKFKKKYLTIHWKIIET